jgi:hypothetical protein
MTGTLLPKPVGSYWFRGSGRRDGEWVVIDPAETTFYDPTDDRKIGVQLARVTTPDDAVRFVRRYGLLDSHRDKFAAGFKQAEVISDLAPITLIRLVPEPGVVYRERIDDILDEARQLRELLTFAINAQRAAAGDGHATDRLRRAVMAVDFFMDVSTTTAERAAEIVEAETQSRQEALEHPERYWTRYVAMALSRRIGSAELFLRPFGPGRFEFTLQGVTLLDFCYLSAAYILSDNPSLATCEECARVYVIEDKRQRFCEPKCASRSRARAFDERRKNELNSKSPQGGNRHGKKTRTR